MAEDYTTFSGPDPNTRFNITSLKIDVTGLSRNEDAYKYKDFGVDYFDGDLEHDVDVYVDSASSSFGRIAVWNLANVIEDSYTQEQEDRDYLRIALESGNHLRIWEGSGGSRYWTGTYELTEDTPYYLRIKRDESIGTYGTVYLDIYTSAADRTAETGAVGNLSLGLSNDKNDYKIIQSFQIIGMVSRFFWGSMIFLTIPY